MLDFVYTLCYLYIQTLKTYIQGFGMGNIIFRVGADQKSAYETSARAAGLSLSDWLKGMADRASGYGRADLPVLDKSRGKGKVLGGWVVSRGRFYTGATAVFNGELRYEYETDGGLRWTSEGPE